MGINDEEDVTIIGYLLNAVMNGKNTVRVTSDDNDVFA